MPGFEFNFHTQSPSPTLSSTTKFKTLFLTSYEILCLFIIEYLISTDILATFHNDV